MLQSCVVSNVTNLFYIIPIVGRINFYSNILLVHILITRKIPLKSNWKSTSWAAYLMCTREHVYMCVSDCLWHVTSIFLISIIYFRSIYLFTFTNEDHRVYWEIKRLNSYDPIRHLNFLIWACFTEFQSISVCSIKSFDLELFHNQYPYHLNFLLHGWTI